MGPRRRRGWAEGLAWVGLLSLVAYVVPLLVRMPLTLDAINYDVCARVVRRGGVPYRDAFDNNLPGAVWIHCAVRGLFGESPEALRGFDLVVVGAVIGLLVGWLAPLGRPRAARVVTAALLLAFYSSRWEWCQCQRDTWMLLPALGALYLRRAQVNRLRAPGSPARRLAVSAVAEGLVWGAAVWIKPFVVLLALASWAVGALLVRGAPTRVGRRLALDAAGLLLGGLLAGAVGSAWLAASGAWGPMWDVLLGWNREYLADVTVAFRLEKLREAAEHFFPWGLVLAGGLAVAAAVLPRALRRQEGSAAVAPARAHALLAAFFLAWAAQAFLVQRPLDYVFVPPVLLAVTLVAGCQPPPWLRPVAWGLVGILVALIAVRRGDQRDGGALVAVRHPLLAPQRVRLWPDCFRPGRSGELRARLAVDGSVDWAALDRAAAYLRGRVGDGELTCYHAPAIPLYEDLRLTPSTRYIYLHNTLAVFPSHRDEVRSAATASRQRYIVTDLLMMGLSEAEVQTIPPEGEPAVPDGRLGALRLAAGRPRFPWASPIVFRAGRYLVLQVPEGKAGDPGG